MDMLAGGGLADSVVGSAAADALELGYVPEKLTGIEQHQGHHIISYTYFNSI
jgi:hypothetical protein